ncbi:hypothetical protein D6D01_06242 [Aureobasidium pullulans]|uniref:Uncharacterized protein n=1 Tax=Aureobasidium pullulans TaxID=5580 RepID=A0A4S9L356_AURPU|nr:hypothetical protein D6D01_06242 [Aureobasidium pullulans]
MASVSTKTQFIFKRAMSSLFNLPPEVRRIVYDEMIRDALASDKRIIYCDHDSQYDELYRAIVEKPTMWFRSKMKFGTDHQGRIDLLTEDTSSSAGTIAYGTCILDTAIHHANIDALLALASTCRQLRAEVLHHAWENADIRIFTRDDTYLEAMVHIFEMHLSTEVCELIRTLFIEVGECWMPWDVSEIAQFIMRRLPNLKHLIVAVARRNTEDWDLDFEIGLKVLSILPFSIDVEIEAYIHADVIDCGSLTPLIIHCACKDFTKLAPDAEYWERATGWHDTFALNIWREWKQCEIAMRTQNEERHIDASLLEDTFGIRSEMAGWPVIASQITPKERWEVRREGKWEEDWLVREGIDDEAKQEPRDGSVEEPDAESA